MKATLAKMNDGSIHQPSLTLKGDFHNDSESTNNPVRTKHERRRVGPASPRPRHDRTARARCTSSPACGPSSPTPTSWRSRRRWPRAVGSSRLEKRSRSETTKLGLIRTARWFVGTSTEFGPTLYFVSQFDSSLEKYFDDFVLNGKENLAAIWGHCIGCPTGPDATARDIVQYIARGQIKTLACYDVASEPQHQPDPEEGRLVREDAEVPACGRRRRRQPRGQGQRLLEASWPSPTSSCRAAPPSTPTSASEWQYDRRRRAVGRGRPRRPTSAVDRPWHDRGSIRSPTREDHDDEQCNSDSAESDRR